IHDNWKESIPRGIKNLTDWELYTVNMASLFCKEILIYTMGKTKNEIETFLKGLEGFQEAEAKQVISIFRKPGQEWRNSIPELIKYLVKDWASISSDQLKSEVLDLIDQSKGIAVYLFEDYLGIIEDLEMGSETYEEDYFDNLMYNSLEIVEKYKGGAIRIPEEDRTESTDESWRKMVPSVLKKQIKDWKTDSLLDVYNQAKEIMRRSKGEEWEEIVEFVTEMSQIIFVKESEEDPIEDDYQSTDEIAESIMSLVEMIILPRLEVLDILKEKGGNVIFGNLWNVPFPESLTTEVKDRDNWKCVICENETELHVHHKIPRNLGGIHHIDNLVTLCASCHGAIETADINHAFTKCLANYKKQKFSKGRKFDEITKDKKLLKTEIENSLDKLLIDLN
ncbi:HNH endonuclease, partial [Neobacillus drentensis]|uniref:HNH endonuclease n=1 Tax=Neobacillus drentensis TaxID=220684 RepID=UPI002FFE7767